MCYDCDCCEDTQQNQEIVKMYKAESRISDIFHQHRQDLADMFHTNAPKVPMTGEDLIEAITNKNYTLKPIAEVDGWSRHNPLAYFVWNSPDVKIDPKGFSVAEKELNKFQADILDKVNFGDDAAKLAAIEAFKNWKPSNAPAN